jgi:hypothetical protein
MECWAKRRFGALDAAMISDEQYELNLFELDARAKA